MPISTLMLLKTVCATVDLGASMVTTFPSWSSTCRNANESSAVNMEAAYECRDPARDRSANEWSAKEASSTAASSNTEVSRIGLLCSTCEILRPMGDGAKVSGSTSASSSWKYDRDALYRGSSDRNDCARWYDDAKPVKELDALYDPYGEWNTIDLLGLVDRLGIGMAPYEPTLDDDDWFGTDMSLFIYREFLLTV
ncbi:hypothetical protein OGAPHI_005080 [Ogataea philodendri]|uniref:Uncharacterized protein n=1 Tax=Ogataea philodendri TaxID=1378263 RepID=A0A9P8T2Z4_9ASCO|nr:uncharacterized protein OGAPHI_005080 [Ogataea philodendri]KAH3663679.1 hypothetical protein OGAPHI_005080 [Ogataea philodendri]